MPAVGQCHRHLTTSLVSFLRPPPSYEQGQILPEILWHNEDSSSLLLLLHLTELPQWYNVGRIGNLITEVLFIILNSVTTNRPSKSLLTSFPLSLYPAILFSAITYPVFMTCCWVALILFGDQYRSLFLYKCFMCVALEIQCQLA